MHRDQSFNALEILEIEELEVRQAPTIVWGENQAGGPVLPKS